MFLSLKKNSTVVFALLILSSPIMANTWDLNCPKIVEVKNGKILEVNGWFATTHAHKRGAHEKYPLMDGEYKTDAKAPRLASFNINSKKVDPVAFDNLDEVMYPEDFGLSDPVGYWALKPMENEKWVYFCSADSKSIFLYKFVPVEVKKCSYIEGKKEKIEWGNAALVCE